MSKTHATDVFISYATADKPRLRKVIDELRLRGLLDEGDKIIDMSDVVMPGLTFRDQLRETIEKAGKVIVIWSGSSATSGWVNYEAGMAQALGKPTFFVIPKGEKSRPPTPIMQDQVIEIDG